MIIFVTNKFVTKYLLLNSCKFTLQIRLNTLFEHLIISAHGDVNLKSKLLVVFGKCVQGLDQLIPTF